MPQHAIAIVGPTASGKSHAAMWIAERMPVEIVSMDSAQVYRGMDIGTAKPTPAERAAVPHHLLDLIDPTEAYSAARFRADAHEAICAIAGRGRLPMVVGGTMLYLKALREGLSALPATEPAIREAIRKEARSAGWPALHARLASIDPDMAARLAPGDAQRIGRALEVHAMTGRTMTSFFRAGAARDDGPIDAGLSLIVIALMPLDRSQLHRRIAQRFDAMLGAGLVDELADLRRRFALGPDLASMRCVGYRQAWQFLDGTISAAELREQGHAATRQLAKRQMTWIRPMSDVITIACDARDMPDQVLRAVQAKLDGNG